MLILFFSVEKSVLSHCARKNYMDGYLDGFAASNKPGEDSKRYFFIQTL